MTQRETIGMKGKKNYGFQVIIYQWTVGYIDYMLYRNGTAVSNVSIGTLWSNRGIEQTQVRVNIAAFGITTNRYPFDYATFAIRAAVIEWSSITTRIGH